MPEQSNDYRVVVFGAGGVGKSSLVLRFVKGTFRESYIPTIEDTYRQGHAFILVYSVTSRQSLEELRPIWDAIKETKGAELEGIPVMLVGNKCDEGGEDGAGGAREVRPEEGEAEAQRWGCKFMETSAKTNHNVKELFQELLNMEKNRNISLQLDSKKKGKGGGGAGKGAGKMKEKCSVM
ncbi:hypothetical protein J437_LFUL007714 [Ladona fulva]|uniref:Uncharacterized protein n=1 Tax=Ladona fulva TaxID=123851 RepID=A0A8K0P1C0_LADFU|nr:hypothetical protein J437_LFUL007714 [Ladona fulva]